MTTLRAPFPWFGGKSRAAHLVWERFGDVPNYVEPFFGSGAILLARPGTPGTETVNDLDCYVSNFFRAVSVAPDETAEWANGPVNEADLHARHKWLVAQTEFRERMKSDPDFFDTKVAGWWVLGLCQWIGSGWTSRPEWTGRTNAGAHGRGIQQKSARGRGDGAASQAPPEQLPHLGTAGMGLHRKLPHLGDAGRGRDVIREWFGALSERLARVRVACGDWSRVVGPSVTVKHGLTGVLLDPPYSSDQHDVSYSASSGDVAQEVRAWTVANGDNPLLRIALCGYEGEHEMPEEWECVPWKAKGGYGSQRKSGTNDNPRRERIWFSPACLQPRTVAPLFAEPAEAAS